MLSCSPPIERCRPLLGTFVRIRVHGLAAQAARIAINAAFAEVAAVHQLMSFHEPDSDVSCLNREAASRPVAVDERTFEVLACAQEVSRASSGAFDITVAPELVRSGALPAPRAPAPEPEATWRDTLPCCRTPA